MTNDPLMDKLKRMPPLPGIYLMKATGGEIIYIGKAGNLKKRLATYFNATHPWDMKTQILVQKISDIETIITRTEKEALILESNLIKRHKPRYNVVLKDDKRYPSLRLDVGGPFPSLTIVRKPEKDGALYFGPYASAHAVRQTLNIVNKTFKLRKCKSRDFKKRTRPCLHCQMQRCLAPCCLDVDPAGYQEMVKEAILFLKGRTRDLVQKVKEDMMAAARAQEFERAARLRDKMYALEKTIEKQVAVTADLKDRDVLALYRSEGYTLLCLLIVRGGYLTGTRHFLFTETMATEKEVIGTFIRQYYEKASFIPKEVLVSVRPADEKLHEEWLTNLKKEVVRILWPRRGEKATLISLAIQNAAKELAERLAKIQTNDRMLERLQKRLHLKSKPERIECIDNSNILGTEPVAALVVFENGLPSRSLYRKYRIQTVKTPDDYAAMSEILKRRFGKGEDSLPHPDLLMLDGGKGQLNVATAALRDLQIDTPMGVIGIAKRDDKKGETEDKVYVSGRANPVQFGRDGDLLLLLQRVRDEAHRFAITYHRKRRNERSLQSILDTVPGVGVRRKNLLLTHFGSVKNIRAAPLEELSALPGITDSVARAIKGRLGSSTP